MDASAMLVRPDGFVAWTCDLTTGKKTPSSCGAVRYRKPVDSQGMTATTISANSSTAM
ncbi:MAG: hypothetical protein ACRYF2_19505 [Janthinobacterium lividum]